MRKRKICAVVLMVSVIFSQMSVDFMASEEVVITEESEGVVTQDIEELDVVEQETGPYAEIEEGTMSDDGADAEEVEDIVLTTEEADIETDTEAESAEIFVGEDTTEEASEESTEISVEMDAGLLEVADTLTSGDFTYTVDSSGNATITGYTGSDSSVTVPSSVGGYTVTVIGDSAFSCSTITSLEIPESVTTVGYNIIKDSSITEITIPKSVTTCNYNRYRSKSGTLYYMGALSGCSTLKTVIFEEGMETIPDFICASDFDPNGIETVVIPDTVTTIGSYAFHCCGKLSEISGMAGVEVIEDCAFYECTSLQSVSIGSSMEELGYCSFKNCTSLKSVDLGTGIEILDSQVFLGCSALTKLTIPESVTTLGDNIIKDTSITEITIPASVTKCNYSYSTSSNNTKYYSGALSGCSTLKKVIFEEGMETIPDYLCASDFYETGIETVVIPDTVTTIGVRAFCSCENLSEISGMTGVETIEDYAFYECSLLQSVSFGSSTKKLGDGSFQNCTSLQSVDLGTGMETLEGEAFAGCTSLESVDLGTSITTLGGHVFSGCSALTELTIPESVTTLGDNIIKDTSITEITIPASVTICNYSYTTSSNNTKYYSGALSGCSTLKKVIFEEGMETIPDYFCASDYYEIGIETVVIPDKVTTIGVKAFSGCSALTELTIPGSVTTIGASAFSGCSSLEKVIFEEAALPDIQNVKAEQDDETSDDDTHVLKISWELANNGGLKSIGSDAFADCTALTTIVYPGTEEEWGEIEIASGNDALTSATKEFQSFSNFTDSQVQIGTDENFQDAQQQYVTYGEEKKLSATITAEKKVGTYYIHVRSCQIVPLDDDSGRSSVKYGEWSETFVLTVKNVITAKDVKESVEAFCDALEDYQEALSKESKADSENYEQNTVSKGKLLMEKDEATNDRLINFTNLNLTERQKLAIYDVLAEYLETTDSFKLDKIKVASNKTLTSYATKIIKEVLNNIEKNSGSYSQYTTSGLVEFNYTGFGSSAGDVLLNNKLVGAFTSGTSGTYATLAAYLENLSEVTEDLMYQSLASVFSELAEVSQLTALVTEEKEAWIKSWDSTIEANLKTAGYGKLKKVVAGGITGYNVVKKVKSAATTDDLNQALKDAESIYKTIDGLDFSDDSVDKQLLSAATKELENQRKDLKNTLYAYIHKTDKDEPTSVAGKILRKLGINCPVDFEIKDSSGNTVGSVVDGRASFLPTVTILVNGSTKEAWVDVNESYTIIFTGTGSGTMNYTIRDTQDGAVLGQVNYLGVSLEDGIVYTQNLSGGALSSDSTGDPLVADTSGVNVTGTSHLDADGNPSYVNVTCTTSEGGTASLDTEEESVEKGTVVCATAMPEDGYRLIGWYVEDELVETSEAYYFAAVKDISLEARFTKKTVFDSSYGAVMGEDYQDSAKICLVKEDASDSTSGSTDKLVLYLEEDQDSDLTVTIRIYTDEETYTDKEATLTREDSGKFVLEGLDVSSGTKIEIFDSEEKLIGTILPSSEIPVEYCEEGGHDYDLISEQAATCDEAGFQKMECFLCGKTEEVILPATGHSWDDGVVTEEATCGETGTRTYTCTSCGTTKTEPIAAAGTHSWGSWTTVTEATVLKQAERTHTCSLCGEVENEEFGAKLTPTIKVNASSLKLQTKQKTTKFKVTFATGDSVQSWKSSNTKIVKVTGKANGTCTITAQKKTGKAYITIKLKSGLSKKIKVTVQKGAVKTTSVKVNAKKVTLKKKGTAKITATIAPITSKEKVTYTSSDKKIATVSKSGKITAKKKGTCKITVKSGSKSVKITVTVK